METKTYQKLKSKKQDNLPEIIIVHHSGGLSANSLADTSNQTAQDMEKWHLSLGWEGLGYHYVIHKNGDMWKGRPEQYHGAHCTTHNYKSIGVCLAGNFDLTLPTKEQENSLAQLLKDIMTRYSITKDEIYPHRRFANKTCYGKNLSNSWAKELLEKEEMVTIPRRLLEQLLYYLK